MASVNEVFDHSDTVEETDATVLLKLVLQICLSACVSNALLLVWDDSFKATRTNYLKIGCPCILLYMCSISSSDTPFVGIKKQGHLYMFHICYAGRMCNPDFPICEIDI